MEGSEVKGGRKCRTQIYISIQISEGRKEMEEVQEGRKEGGKETRGDIKEGRKRGK